MSIWLGELDVAQLTATCGEYIDFCLEHELGSLQM